MIKGYLRQIILWTMLILIFGLIPTIAAQRDDNYCEMSQEIEDGDSVEERLDDDEYLLGYCFEADEDDIVRIRAEATDGDLMLAIIVIDALGEVDEPFGSDYARSEDDRLNIELTIPEDGDYVIFVSREDFDEGDSEGDFMMTFELEPAEPGRNDPRRGHRNATGLPDQLRDYDADWRAAVHELEEEGIIAYGGNLILRENNVFSDARTAGYVPIGSGTSSRDVVVAATIQFDTESDYGLCGISTRVDSNSAIVVFMDGEGTLFIYDSEQYDFYEADTDLDPEDENHLLFIAQDDELTVYINGELTFEKVDIRDDNGTLGMFMDPDGERARCDLTNFWAHEAPEVVDGLCEVESNTTVNRRSGPGTNYDRVGQINPNQAFEIIGSDEGDDGYTWYEVDDESWVREDVVRITGDCRDIASE